MAHERTHKFSGTTGEVSYEKSLALYITRHLLEKTTASLHSRIAAIWVPHFVDPNLQKKDTLTVSYHLLLGHSPITVTIIDTAGA